MRSFIFLFLIQFVLFANAQNNLPDWFLAPPVSADNSCIYLIGISDPGMNRDVAMEQAEARAKTTLNIVMQDYKPTLQLMAASGGAFSDVVFKSINAKKYHKANFEVVNSFLTNYNEVIVLLKYSFVERAKSVTTDSVEVKSLFKSYSSDDGINKESVIECVSKVIDIEKKTNWYYSVSSKNETDSLYSYFINKQTEVIPNLKDLNNKYKNQHSIVNNTLTDQRFNISKKSAYGLKNGLWFAYFQSFLDATNSINAEVLTKIEKSGNSYTESMIITKQLVVKDNQLEANFGGAMFSEGFITKTYPEDIDSDIPQNKQKIANRFALIIGNEDYSSFQQGLNTEVNVEFAENDASMFYQYATKTLGVPAENAILHTNARAMDMHKAVEKLSLLAKSLNGKAELIFYYAGHGLPDENKEPYLIPVDVSGNDIQFAIKLKDLYAKLTQYPVQRVTVILDACFSGGARNQGLVAARGVKVKAKEDTLTGNLVVLAASSGEQSSLPYKEKKHGMFTFMLLKKIQETQGDITYNDMVSYLQEQVGVKSLLVNSKEQTPQANVSATLGDDWKSWKMNGK